jgi:hypothetical protein
VSKQLWRRVFSALFCVLVVSRFAWSLDVAIFNGGDSNCCMLRNEDKALFIDCGAQAPDGFCDLVGPMMRDLLRDVTEVKIFVTHAASRVRF